MRTVTYDRSAAVNLARNVLKFKADKTITAKGVRILCEAVIGMDAALAAAPDHPATAGDAEDAARYRAWRDSACRDDIEFLDVMDQHISTANGGDDEAVPTPAQIDAAIDAPMRTGTGGAR